MNKLTNIVAILLATFGVLGNNGYSDLGLSEWEVIDISNTKSNDWEVFDNNIQHPQMIKNVSEIKDLKKSIILDDSDEVQSPKIINNVSEIKDLKKSVILDDSKKKIEKLVQNNYIKSIFKNLYNNTKKLLADLDTKLNNFINNSNEFVKNIADKKINERNYIGMFNKVQEENVQFIDELNEFKDDISKFKKSIKSQITNVYEKKHELSWTDLQKKFDNIVINIINQFEEYADRFNYLFNNKKDDEVFQKYNINYNDKISDVLQYASKPYFATNEPVQKLIKESKKFINKMIEENNDVQSKMSNKNAIMKNLNIYVF